MAVSKVIAVHPDGTFTNDYGVLYKFRYAFEDGTTITANHKTEEPRFKPGDDAEYMVNGTRDGNAWGKVTRPEGGKRSYTMQRSNDQTTERIERSWAFGQAVQILGSLDAVNTDSVKKYMIEACRLAEVCLKARDTFPKFEGDEVVRATWESQMAPEGDLPF
jgi:hypothetical protein